MSIINNKFFVLGSNFEGSDDPLRQILSAYWIQKDEDISFAGELALDDEGFINRGNSAKFIIEKQELIDGEIEVDSGFIYRYPIIYQEIIIRDRSPYGGPTGMTVAYQTFLDEIDKIKDQDPVIFEDYAFSLDTPIVYPSSHDNQSKLEGDVDFIYNYGLENYESTIAPTDFDESTILNYYDYFERKQGIKVVTYGGLPKVWRADHKDPLNDSNPAVSKLNVTTKLEDPLYLEEQPSQQNYFITSEDYESAMNLRDSEIDADGNSIFPFCAKISFSSINSRNKSSSTTTEEGTDSTTAATTVDTSGGSTSYATDDAVDVDLKARYVNVPVAILHPDQSLFTSIASYCSDLLAPGGVSDYFDKKAFNNNTLIPEYADALQTLFDEVYTIESNTLSLVDIFLMVNNLYNQESVNATPPTKGYYRDGSDETYMAKGDEDFKNLVAGALEIFLGEVEEKSYENVRTYTDILNGTPSYESDIVFYKISKFDASADGDGAIPLQNIWIPGNSGTSDKIVNYIDFQVKYGKRYTYKVYAYKFVIGTKYIYQIEDIVEAVEEEGDDTTAPKVPDDLSPFDEGMDHPKKIVDREEELPSNSGRGDGSHGDK